MIGRNKYRFKKVADCLAFFDDYYFAHNALIKEMQKGRYDEHQYSRGEKYPCYPVDLKGDRAKSVTGYEGSFRSSHHLELFLIKPRAEAKSRNAAADMSEVGYIILDRDTRVYLLSEVDSRDYDKRERYFALFHIGKRA